MSVTIERTDRVRSEGTLSNAVARLGEYKKQQNDLAAERDRQIAEIRAAYGPDIETLDHAIDVQMTRIGAFVKERRDSLFPDGVKHTDTPAGRIAVQTGAVVTKVTDEEAAIAFLRKKRGKLAECLRVKHSLDKTRLKRLEAEVPGIEYVVGRERLQVTPANLGTVVSDEL